MTKEKLEKEAREYLAEHSEYSEVFEETFVAVDTLTAMVDFAEPREKRIEELKEENNKLLDVINNQDVKIADLEEKNAVLERRIERAKECMRKLLFIINSDPANYNCKGLIQDAEDFIYNRTCNIRQQGEHCISETRCIMCDKEIEK